MFEMKKGGAVEGEKRENLSPPAKHPKRWREGLYRRKCDEKAQALSKGGSACQEKRGQRRCLSRSQNLSRKKIFRKSLKGSKS